ncbi:hypothetical protein D3C87_1013820 [compost metagenome]
MFLGKSSDPQIDTVDPLDHTSPIGLHCNLDIRIDFAKSCDFAGFQNEVRISLPELGDHGIGEVVAALEVVPGCVGRHCSCITQRFCNIRVGGCCEVHANLIERSKSDVPASGNIEGKQVRVDTDEVVSHGIDNVEIDRFSGLCRDTTKDRAHTELFVAFLWNISVLRKCAQRQLEGTWIVCGIQEGIEQCHLGRVPIRVEYRHGLADQRMTDPIDRSGEFMTDRSRSIRIVLRKTVVAVSSYAADQLVRKFGEDNALIFGFIDHLGGLEQFLGCSIKTGRLKACHMKIVVSGPDGVH